MTLFLIFFAVYANAADAVKVSNRSVSEQELSQFLAFKGITDGQKDQILRDPIAKNEMAHRLVEEEILAAEAEKQKIDQTPEAKAAIQAFKRVYLASKVRENFLTPKRNEKTLKEYYKTHSYRYTTDQAQIQHIVLATESEARNMLKLAQAPDANFQALAEKYSKDPNAKNNRGDFGTITREVPFSTVFNDEVFRAKKGQLVGPLLSPIGYHIVKIMNKTLGKNIPYEDVAMRVRADFEADIMTVYLTQLNTNSARLPAANSAE